MTIKIAMKDAYYFSHDSNAHNDIKIKEMRCVYGAEGYGWYWIIVELMRDQSDYRLQYNGKYSVQIYADELKTTNEKAMQFIKDCINEFKLFKSNGEYFWSESLMRRLKVLEDKREKLSKAGIKGASKRWGSNNKANGEVIAVKESKVKESKVKESKVKESKVKEKEINTILLFYKNLTLKTKMSKVPGEVNARLKEGYTVQEAKYVILYKFLEWWDDRKTKTWVNLTTLFRPSHFEEYLSQAEQGLDELINQRYKRFKKHWYDENMNKPLEERKKLKLPDFKEYRQKMLGEILEEGNGESSPKTAT